MKQDHKSKIQFWLKLAGWLCLVPASVNLYLFQMMQGTIAAQFYLVELIITVLFAFYLLITFKSERWFKVKNLFWLMIFTLILVSFIIVIPVFFAYREGKKIQKE